jgi:hypothetical protein
MSMLRDQRDLLSAFNAEGVEYLIVGGHAVNAHGVPRLTKDLDVFISGSEKNGERVFRALVRFGAPLQGLSPADFAGHEDDVFQIGVEPNRIDILQSISGVDFGGAWERKVFFEVEEGLTAPFLAIDDVIANKLEVGRIQDLADADHLKRMKRSTST